MLFLERGSNLGFTTCTSGSRVEGFRVSWLHRDAAIDRVQ